MRYKPEQKLESKDQILKAARTVFAEIGFERATIEKVMSEAGMTRGGFYKHFPDKAALLLQIVSDGEVLVPESVSCKATDILRRYLDEAHSEDRANACPLFAFTSDITHQNDELKSAYEKVAQSIAGALTLALPDQNKETALALMAMSVGCMVVINSSLNDEFKDSLRDASLAHIAKTTAIDT